MDTAQLISYHKSLLTIRDLFTDTEAESGKQLLAAVDNELVKVLKLATGGVEKAADESIISGIIAQVKQLPPSYQKRVAKALWAKYKHS